MMEKIRINKLAQDDVDLKNLFIKTSLPVIRIYKSSCNTTNILLIIIIFMVIGSFLIKVIHSERNAIPDCQILVEQAHKNLHEKIKHLEERIEHISFKLQDISANRVRSLRSIKDHDTKSYIPKLVNQNLKIKSDHNNSNTIMIMYNSTVPFAPIKSLDRQNNKRKNWIFNIDLMSRPNSNSTVGSKMKDLSRKKRDVLKIEEKNYTTNDEKTDNNTVNKLKKSQTTKTRRDNRRNKEWCQNQRPKHNRMRLDPAIVTFVGAIPEQEFKNGVYIGPWIESNRSDGRYNLSKFYLTEENYSIETSISGLYMISVQISYFGRAINHSYWVLLNSEGTSIKRKLIKCSVASDASASEVSCYTSTMTYLRKGDRLLLQQQEKNSLINLREGYSQVQLLLYPKISRRKAIRK